MADTNQIITINISRNTQGVSRQGFGVPLFIGNTQGIFAAGEYVRTYTGKEGVLADFGENTPEYKAALRFFGSDTEPTQIQIGVHATEESITESLFNIRAQDADAYFLTAYTRVKEEVMALAEYAQSETMIFGTATSEEAALIALDTTDIGSMLQAKGYSNTFVMHVANEAEFPECGIIGKQAPKDPGSTTWKFKTVNGITAAKLSPSQSKILKGDKYSVGKGYNTYETVGGRSIFAEGRMANGEFIDVIRFAHWLEVRLRERLFLLMVNSEKVEQTTTGYALIEGGIREVLNRGIAVGGLLSYTLIVPNPRAADPNERANRVANGFKFNGILKGAVHFLGIDGNLEI